MNNPKTKRDYVSNKQFYEEILKHNEKKKYCQENQLEPPILSDYIGECLLLIAKRLSNKPNFIGYPHKEEMIADGIENCVKYFHVFNPERSKNPFSFFTQTIKNAFIRRIKLEKKQMYVRLKSTQNFMLTCQLIDNTLIVDPMTDNANRFIKDYENSVFTKKNKPVGLEKVIEDNDQPKQASSTNDSNDDRVAAKQEREDAYS
jgi:hypothetical protein